MVRLRSSSSVISGPPGYRLATEKPLKVWDNSWFAKWKKFTLEQQIIKIFASCQFHGRIKHRSECFWRARNREKTSTENCKSLWGNFKTVENLKIMILVMSNKF